MGTRKRCVIHSIIDKIIRGFVCQKKVKYIPRNMHTVFALLCFVVVIHWLIFPYPSGLLHWHCGNLTIAPVPAKQPCWIWINTSCEFIMNDCITTTKQSTTKPCAYFLGYTVSGAGTSDYIPLILWDVITSPFPGYLLLAYTWWRHQMKTFSALLAICAGNSPVPGEFPTQRPVTRSFDVNFDLRPNKRLSKQSWGWWFETQSRPLWRHRNEVLIYGWSILFYVVFYVKRELIPRWGKVYKCIHTYIYISLKQCMMSSMLLKSAKWINNNVDVKSMFVSILLNLQEIPRGK